MSDSTINDAIRLLEIGKGNVDRLKQIIESFETRSLIPLQDRKYVEALVQQYLTPRHRIRIKKIEPTRKQQTDSPRTLKPTKPDFDLQQDNESTKNEVGSEIAKVGTQTNKICSQCGYQNSVGNNFCNNCGSRLEYFEKIQSQTSDKIKDETAFERYEREYLERQLGKTSKSIKEESVEEKFVEYLEAKPNASKKSNKKFIGIAIGIVAIIIIVGGAAFVANDSDFSSTSKIEERISCDTSPMLISATKIPGFPDPEKDLQYYLDRYNNEPNYKDWFDRNFPDQTIHDVLVVSTSIPSATKIPGFPDPEKDLQYYLDRYNNEPNYKDWFDRNFPDQTIQSVVCP